MNQPPELSVVLIARNEEAHIAKAIESVLTAIKNWSSGEVLLVDSASTDSTVAIARQYPINIFRIPPTFFLSASAGRYIGMLRSSGDLIMFLDGDMEMAPEWLDQAIPYMLEHPEAAAVTGYRHDVYMEAGQIIDEQDFFSGPFGQTSEIKHLGGAALYRRAALEKVGGCNPYLISEEEPELCMRLRYAGHRLFCIPVRVCTNYTLPVRSWKYFSQRIASRLWLGHGQTLRYHLHTGMLWMVTKERATFVPLLLIILLALASFALAWLSGSMFWIGIWLAGFLIAFSVYWVRKGSLQNVATSIVHQICILYGGIRGFLIQPIPASHYPTEVEVVQSDYCRQGLAS